MRRGTLGQLEVGRRDVCEAGRRWEARTGQGFSWLPLSPLVGQSAIYLLWGRNLELCGGKAVGLQTQ